MHAVARAQYKHNTVGRPLIPDDSGTMYMLTGLQRNEADAVA